MNLLKLRGIGYLKKLTHQIEVQYGSCVISALEFWKLTTVYWSNQAIFTGLRETIFHNFRDSMY